MIDERYDVVVLGGAFAGASTALLLRRDAPHLRVLIVEKLVQFDEKVGEATTEMSAMFLTRRLAQWRHLELEQLPKEGLRYWFHNEHVTSHFDASESGAFLRSTVPSFQLRRDALDENILATAVAEGAELLRPARVRDVELAPYDNVVVIEQDGVEKRIRCSWVVDATGRVNFVGRKLGIMVKNEEHPTASMWARFKNVRHIDEIAARGPLEFSRKNVGSRRLATNHYMGFGHWIWVIPLRNGETSIGVVWDKRLVNLHESRDREAAFLAFLNSKIALSQLLEGSQIRSDDFRYYSHLPYVTKQYMGEGWALVGDAAAFIDPYYSPGLDHAAFSVEATVEIIKKQTSSSDVAMMIREHNETFLRSYDRFFRAAYRDKYYYMGEHDLLTASFMMDTAFYYNFVVIPAYRFFGKFQWMPVLGPKPAGFAFNLMKLYNRRFKTIAIARREAGEAERRNNGRRVSLFMNLGLAPSWVFTRAATMWMKAEIDLLRLRLMSLFRTAPSREELHAEARGAGASGPRV
jgi:flavin-dependent dehydrogenase